MRLCRQSAFYPSLGIVRGVGVSGFPEWEFQSTEEMACSRLGEREVSVSFTVVNNGVWYPQNSADPDRIEFDIRPVIPNSLGTFYLTEIPSPPPDSWYPANLISNVGGNLALNEINHPNGWGLIWHGDPGGGTTYKVDMEFKGCFPNPPESSMLVKMGPRNVFTELDVGLNIEALFRCVGCDCDCTKPFTVSTSPGAGEYRPLFLESPQIICMQDFTFEILGVPVVANSVNCPIKVLDKGPDPDASGNPPDLIVEIELECTKVEVYNFSIAPVSIAGNKTSKVTMNFGPVSPREILFCFDIEKSDPRSCCLSATIRVSAGEEFTLLTYAEQDCRTVLPCDATTWGCPEPSFSPCEDYDGAGDNICPGPQGLASPDPHQESITSTQEIQGKCQFLNDDNTCEMASLIAEEPIKTNQSICQKCQACDRPMRLNEFTISLLPPEKIEKATQVMVNENSGGIGSDLEYVFGFFAKKNEGCGCGGMRDALNALNVSQVEANKDSIVNRIARKAKKMGVPFASTAVRAALEAVIIKHKVFKNERRK
jgi:hypothetical protein